PLILMLNEVLNDISKNGNLNDNFFEKKPLNPAERKRRATVLI
ncbi:unnamed protein product, partial [marine sediment metagenome]